jgi:osmotically-inducible protein OsmY
MLVKLIRLSLVIVSGLFAILGSAPQRREVSVAQQMGDLVQIRVSDDPYSEYVQYKSGEATEKESEEYRVWVLIGTKNRKTADSSFYVQWVNGYVSEGWRSYSGASDSGANSLTVKKIASNVSSCSSDGYCVRSETFNVYFSLPQMQAARTSGIDFKMFSRSGASQVVRIDARIVNSLLSAMML